MRPMPGRTKYSREKGAKVFFAALMHIRLKYKRRSRLKDNTLNIPRKSFLSFLLVIDDTAYKNTTIRHKQKTFPKSFFIFTCQKNICTAKSLWEILIHSIFVYRICLGKKNSMERGKKTLKRLVLYMYILPLFGLFDHR